jgi:hypothetical protein
MLKMRKFMKIISNVFTILLLFRLLLTELGYQAGEHEQLSEFYTKIIPQNLKTKARED